MCKWFYTKKELPPPNTLVRVLLTNGCAAIDYVNLPIDNNMPFQHYSVEQWRFLKEEELKEIVKNSKVL